MERDTLENPLLKDYCNKLKEQYSLDERVLFVKIPEINFNFFEKKIARNKGYQVYPPTGLQYLSAAIRPRGLDVNILDMNYEFLKRVNFGESFDSNTWMSILEEYLQEHNPSIIGVSNIFDISRLNFLQILDFLKNEWSKSVIIAGGQNATYEANWLLEKELCHFVIQREGENKLNYLLDHLYKDEENKPTLGIIFKYNGRIEETEGDLDVVTLEGDLIEEHELAPSKEYHKVGTLGPFSRMAGDDTPFATLLLNRGCRANCDFCTVRDYMGKGVRTRSIDDVLSEISYLYEKGIRHLEWLDDDFAYDKETLKTILGEINRRRYNLTWSAQNGMIAATLDEELLAAISNSNCLGFKVGVESGNAEILRTIRKPGTLKTFRHFSRRLQKFPKLFVSLNYIIGFPGETFGQVLETFNFSGEMNSDWSGFSIYQSLGEKKEDKEQISENFIPVKSSSKMEIVSQMRSVEGPEVFNLPLNEVPSKEQLKQIWFTFNFVRNFAQNKNLGPRGDLKKLIKWLNVLNETYSLNSDIPFFLALAHQKEGNKKETQRYLQRTKENLDNYWEKRFEQFGLLEILDNFPSNPQEARRVIALLRNRFPEYI